MATRKKKAPKKRTSGPSGRTRTYAERIAKGRVAVLLYLQTDTCAQLDAMALDAGVTRVAMIEALISQVSGNTSDEAPQ